MKNISKSILLALIILTSSLAGCLGNDSDDSDDSKDSDDSVSSSEGCDSAPWLFVMTGHNVTIDLEAEIDTNASNMNASFTIHNEEFIGSVVAYTEAVEGERGEMVTTNNHYETLWMLAAENKNGAITGIKDDGSEVTIAFKLVNVTNSTDGVTLSAEFIGATDNRGENVNGTLFEISEASYLIDSWWCEALVSVGVAAVIAAFCIVTDGTCFAVAEDSEVVEDIIAVGDEYGYDWGNKAVAKALTDFSKSSAGIILDAVFQAVSC